MENWDGVEVDIEGWSTNLIWVTVHMWILRVIRASCGNKRRKHGIAKIKSKGSARNWRRIGVWGNQ